MPDNNDIRKPDAEAGKHVQAGKPVPAEAMAVLLKHAGETPPGRIVRGTPDQIAALVTAGKARRANKADFGIAGGRSVALR